jgi:hypothetical protein
MNVLIGHASIDEKGRITNGQVGDQTKKEICKRYWYNKPWNVYLECPNDEIADKAATIMEQICADNNYGYDQAQRLTGYDAIKANGGKVEGAKGEFDCSSLICACYKLAGVKVSASCTTRNMRKALIDAGFKEYTDINHLTTSNYAKRGGIFLREGHHVVMALEDGGQNPYPVPTSTLIKGDKGAKVKALQWQLRKSGVKELKIDGSFGDITESAVKSY